MSMTITYIFLHLLFFASHVTKILHHVRIARPARGLLRLQGALQLHGRPSQRNDDGAPWQNWETLLVISIYIPGEPIDTQIIAQRGFDTQLGSAY